jgi:hypothetical protein
LNAFVPLVVPNIHADSGDVAAGPRRALALIAPPKTKARGHGEGDAGRQ